jgi:hypothetical protein
MGTDDASFAEMRRRLTDPDADPLALDDETVERLLAGDLPPSQAPPGYARVAALLAATTAEPTAEELAGQAEALAELRAVTRRPRRAAAHTRRAARPPRRRWAGLAAAALVGALVTGGVAVAATGNLPGPVRNVARSILGAGDGAGPVAPTEPGQQPAAVGSSYTSTSTPTGPTDGSQGGQPAATGGPGTHPTAAGSLAGPDVERLCRAFLAGEGAEQGKKLDATAFQDLAKLAGGAEKIPSYCEEVLAVGAEPKDKEQHQQPPGGSGQGHGQGQGGPPTSTGVGNQGQNDQRTTRS